MTRAQDPLAPGARLFFRLDDIGPLSLKTLRLLEFFETLGSPYLLGVIPDALNWWTRRALRTFRHAVFYQHGVHHRNAASTEAPDELPAALGLRRIQSELARGRDSLQQALGQPIAGYVPPWNRISEPALRTLEGDGYSFLSADALYPTTLAQRPVHVDVYAQYRPVVVRSNADLQQEINERLVQSAPVGVVLHPLSLPSNNVAGMQDLIRRNQGRPLS